LNSDGSFTYQPAAGFSGTDSFTYVAQDAFQGSNTATVTIHVHAPPVAANDSYDVNEGATLTIAAPGVLGNDSDPGSLALTAVLGTGPSHGTLTLNSNGSFTYAPAAGFSGTDSFTYTAHDAFQGSNTATVTIHVHAPPVAVNDSYTINENGTLTVPAASGVLANDTDPSGLTLTAVLATGPADGTLTFDADGSFTYVPTAGFHGTDTFTYTAHDSFQGSNTATVTIHVGAPPVAVNDSYDVDEGAILTVPAVSGVLANDTDPSGLTLTAVLGTGPAHGTLTFNSDGSFTYTPAAGFSGTDSFTYVAQDAFQSSNTATVTIHVHAPPVAVNDSYDVNEGATLTVAAVSGVLANDTDPGGLSMTAVLGTGPSHGSLTLNADGSFVYTPAAGFSGTDSFTYTAHDAFQGSNTATVTIHVHAPPVANADSYTVDENATLTVSAASGVLANDTDPGGLTLSAVLGTGPTNGTLTLDADGSFTYTPTTGFHGTDTFTYTAHDSFQGSAPATVTITVLGPPVAVADSYGGATAATALPNNKATTITPASAGVLANDTDPNGFSLIVTQIGAGPGLTGTTTLGATVTMNVNGTFTYDPTSAPAGGTLQELAVGATATDTFQYTISDGHGQTASATVSILVTHPDTPPTASPLAVSAVGNTLFEYGTQASPSNEPKTTATGTLNSLVSDPDPGDSATITAVDTTSAHGGSIVYDAATGGFAYRAAAGFAGTDTFTYTATDTHSESTVGTVTVTVAGKVWYVKNNASGANDGRSGSPFTTLAQAQTASASGDTIYVFGGDGTSTGQAAGITLKSSQRLIGQADALTLGPTTLFPATPASRPQLTASSGAGVTLAAGTTVEGVADNPTGTATGISGDNSVAGATITDVTVADSGSGEGILLTGSTGAVSITSTTVSSGSDDAVEVTQPAGTLNLTLTSDTLTEANVNGNDALNITSTGSAIVNPTISSTTINAARGDLFQLNVGDTSKSTLSFMNNTLSNSNTNIVSGGGGVTITAGGGSAPQATLNFDIEHNTFRGALGNAVALGMNSGNNSVRGTFSNNTVGVQAVPDSGSSQGGDLSVAGLGAGSFAITAEHNNFYQYNNAFGVNFQTTGTFSLDATFDDNTIATPAPDAGSLGVGLQLDAGTTTGDTNAVCFDVSGNSLAGSGFVGGDDIRIRQRQSTAVRLPGYVGTTAAAVETFEIAQNSPPTPTVIAAQAGTITGGGPCNTP
jgi:VCBS repeat-containing protein